MPGYWVAAQMPCTAGLNISEKSRNRLRCPPALEFAADEEVWVGTRRGQGRDGSRVPMVSGAGQSDEGEGRHPLFLEIWEWASITSGWVGGDVTGG